MRTIRALSLMGAAVLLAAGVALAAGRAPGGMCRLYGGERLTRHLNLTGTQQTQVREITSRHRAEFRALRTEKLDPAARSARARELHQKVQSEIAAVLTPAQREKLAKCANQREWTKDRPDGDARARDLMNRVSRELGLTADQRDRVHGIYAQYRDEIRALARDAHTSGADRGGLHERARTLKAKVVAEVRPILTPDQQQKLQAMIEQWEKQHKG